MARTTITVTAAATVILLIYGCAAEPADKPGLCKLRCSDAIITTRDFTIEALTPDLTVRCPALRPNEIVYHTVTSKFLIKRKRDIGTGTEEVAVPGVSITPVIRGLYDRRPESASGGIQGMLTPESNFCSDQCGIVTLDYSLECLAQGDGQVQAYIMSGGLQSELANVTVQSATFDSSKDDDKNETTNP